MTTLSELFYRAYESATSIPWRIYGAHSKRLLCCDYGKTFDSPLDDLTVTKWTKKDDYWRITVSD